MRAVVIGLLVSATPAVAQGPTYASNASRAVVQRMVRAHGGLERWRAAKTLRYDNVFFNPLATEGSPWWVVRETFHMPTRRTYHRWPLDGAELAFDGEKVWTRGWQQANYPNFMALFFFYFVNLPWLTQDTAARIGPTGPASLPGRTGTYDTLRVTWGPPYPPGRTGRDFFVLYVERETGRLGAYQYGIGYGAMLDLMRLPPDRTVFGPVLRLQDHFTTVDGLVFPARMHTGNLEGTRVYGHHALFNYSLTDPWDPSRLAAPPGAVTDTSRAVRRAVVRP